MWAEITRPSIDGNRELRTQATRKPKPMGGHRAALPARPPAVGSHLPSNLKADYGGNRSTGCRVGLRQRIRQPAI